MSLLMQSVNQRAALCVSKLGKPQACTDGYAVMRSCRTSGAKNPVGILRPAGDQSIESFGKKVSCRVILSTFLIAMPEVFEDMTAAEKAQTETVRTGVINSLNNIYTRAKKVSVLTVYSFYYTQQA